MPQKKVIKNSTAPLSTSPVSQATVGGGLVFIGGQMPRDMSTGRIVDGAEAQARLSMQHCLRILEAAGAGPAQVMLATVYLTDLSAKDAVNKVFREVFPVDPPARNLVEVSEIGEGAMVEIALIALAGS
jgi:2-iminobutanoate/2-iminopropanoate deaminase